MNHNKSMRPLDYLLQDVVNTAKDNGDSVVISRPNPGLARLSVLKNVNGKHTSQVIELHGKDPMHVNIFTLKEKLGYPIRLTNLQNLGLTPAQAHILASVPAAS